VDIFAVTCWVKTNRKNSQGNCNASEAFGAGRRTHGKLLCSGGS